MNPFKNVLNENIYSKTVINTSYWNNEIEMILLFIYEKRIWKLLLKWAHFVLGKKNAFDNYEETIEQMNKLT
jgi:hypothetical protein